MNIIPLKGMVCTWTWTMQCQLFYSKFTISLLLYLMCASALPFPLWGYAMVLVAAWWGCKDCSLPIRLVSLGLDRVWFLNTSDMVLFLVLWYSAEGSAHWFLCAAEWSEGICVGAHSLHHLFVNKPASFIPCFQIHTTKKKSFSYISVE